MKWRGEKEKEGKKMEKEEKIEERKFQKLKVEKDGK